MNTKSHWDKLIMTMVLWCLDATSKELEAAAQNPLELRATSMYASFFKDRKRASKPELPPRRQLANRAKSNRGKRKSMITKAPKMTVPK
mmetsp:Transcript_73063/g.143280  ORF Transcript_73063/g.143280 Transcript_73063/m.143280 type:complete len:89 (+) Transcript_73063:544-810(+)